MNVLTLHDEVIVLLLFLLGKTQSKKRLYQGFVQVYFNFDMNEDSLK